jgi:hypothetical protein
VSYGSRGRKPFERASKISHAEIINNPVVKSFLEDCTVPHAAEAGVVESLATPVPAAVHDRISTVVAIDGGYTEVPIRDDFPAASITFFTFGPLLFKLEDLRQLDSETFIAPEDLARLKKIERYTLVLPTRNISRKTKSMRLSVRETLHEFFGAAVGQDPPLVDALRWLLFRGWETGGGATWNLARCPNPLCSATNIELSEATPSVTSCVSCGGPIFIIDALRLHERVEEEQGAGGIQSYVMTSLEQIVLVQLIRALWEVSPKVLREVVFIKDGPLAFFGMTSPLSAPMRELAAFMMDRPDPTGGSGERTCLLNVVGLEKSGAFVEHAMQIEDRLPKNSALILTNDYIYRYIVPGDPSSTDPYGKNTYWGGKLIYKASDANVYVATVPTGDFKSTPSFRDFANLEEVCSVVGNLRCSMYDNALIPIALANKLVSLSDFPSARILENFAKATVKA